MASQAAPRHATHLLWLLPSGPDQIHRLSLRGDLQGHHNDGGDYRGIALSPQAAAHAALVCFQLLFKLVQATLQLCYRLAGQRLGQVKLDLRFGPRAADH